MIGVLPLVLAVALGVDAEVDVGLGIEARTRRTDPPPAPTEGGGVDLTASPHLRLRLSGGADFLLLAYTPRFTDRDAGPNALYEYMHEGELRLHVAPSSTWNLEGFANGGMGRTDLVTETRIAGSGGTGGGTGTGGSATASTISVTQVLEVERLRAGLSLQLEPDRRDEYILSGSGSVDGGANTESAKAYPVQQLVDLSAEWRHSVTRRDQIGPRLSGEWGRVPRLRSSATIATGLLLWRHGTSRQTEVWGGAGAVALSSAADTPVRSRQHEVRPAAELGFVRHLPPPPTDAEQAPAAEGQATESTTMEASTSVDNATSGATAQGGAAASQARAPSRLRDYTADMVAHLGASTNRNTGFAGPQLDANAGLSLPAGERLALTARGIGVMTWTERGRTRTGTLTLGAGYTIRTRIVLDGGAYGTWQQSTPGAAAAGAPSFREVGVFLGLTLDAPPVFR